MFRTTLHDCDGEKFNQHWSFRHPNRRRAYAAIGGWKAKVNILRYHDVVTIYFLGFIPVNQWEVTELEAHQMNWEPARL
jgi:hypothetical protein